MERDFSGGGGSNKSRTAVSARSFERARARVKMVTWTGGQRRDEVREGFSGGKGRDERDRQVGTKDAAG